MQPRTSDLQKQDATHRVAVRGHSRTLAQASVTSLDLRSHNSEVAGSNPAPAIDGLLQLAPFGLSLAFENCGQLGEDTDADGERLLSVVVARRGRPRRPRPEHDHRPEDARGRPRPRTGARRRRQQRGTGVRAPLDRVADPLPRRRRRRGRQPRRPPLDDLDRRPDRALRPTGPAHRSRDLGRARPPRARCATARAREREAGAFLPRRRGEESAHVERFTHRKQ